MQVSITLPVSGGAEVRNGSSVVYLYGYESVNFYPFDCQASKDAVVIHLGATESLDSLISALQELKKRAMPL